VFGRITNTTSKDPFEGGMESAVHNTAHRNNLFLSALHGKGEDDE